MRPLCVRLRRCLRADCSVASCQRAPLSAAQAASGHLRVADAPEAVNRRAMRALLSKAQFTDRPAIPLLLQGHDQCLLEPPQKLDPHKPCPIDALALLQPACIPRPGPLPVESNINPAKDNDGALTTGE